MKFKSSRELPFRLLRLFDLFTSQPPNSSREREVLQKWNEYRVYNFSTNTNQPAPGPDTRVWTIEDSQP